MKPKPQPFLSGIAALAGTHEITALELVGLRLYANSVEGTPEHPKAVKLLADATRLWRDKFNKKKCPHCGK